MNFVKSVLIPGDLVQDKMVPNMPTDASSGSLITKEGAFL
jgi:hypothetical protein